MKLELQRNDEEILKLLSNLNSIEDVANLLEVNTNLINYYLFKSQNYNKFSIPKKNGKPRIIHAPITNIKILQNKLLYVFNLIYEPNNYTFGYINNRSIVDNAKHHCQKNFILNIDLSNFFPSISYKRIFGYLVKKLKIGIKAARIITKIICIEENSKTYLPQGGVTSPIISNFISEKLDECLSNYAKKFRCDYTRYADDITISSNDKQFPSKIAFQDQHRQVWLHKNFSKLITLNGFDINFEKLRLRKINQRQEVTGLIVNGLKPNVKRSYIRNLRSILYNWESKGYDYIQLMYNIKYRKFSNDETKKIPKIENVIEGKLNFLSMVRGKDDEIYLKLKIRFLKLKETLENI